MVLKPSASNKYTCSKYSRGWIDLPGLKIMIRKIEYLMNLEDR